MTTLAENCAAEVAARSALKAHQEEAQKREQQLKAELAAARERVGIARAGCDVAKAELGRSVLHLRGSFTNSPERRAVVQDMVDWLSTGEKRTYYAPTEGYFGVKNYDRFGDQREDHEYGSGPKHGSIVFAIGLNDRKRALTGEEREAALYFLLNIETLEAAKSAARVAA